jgi:hypothetical protein
MVLTSCIEQQWIDAMTRYWRQLAFATFHLQAAKMLAERAAIMGVCTGTASGLLVDDVGLLATVDDRGIVGLVDEQTLGGRSDVASVAVAELVEVPTRIGTA